MEEIKESTKKMFLNGIMCSQVMVILGLKAKEIKNEELVRAMYSFGGGFFAGRTCGTLVGGAALISMFLEDTENGNEKAKELINEYVNWFEKEGSSINCVDIRKEDQMEMIEECSGLVEKNFEYIVKLLNDNGVDIYSE
ncbi:C-GCAxxG-C-C family protein [Miniphocaeibacter massiliensis]|uniref:C-GCAxxG-C-C family protein n=1 Tax=Miniphocaeibacter massiliensis TaxID=2041841 RepID=UPI000C1C782E|nr:C-GCAxxG-C-C family protein [Miniphocaeibacter massiliensis]